MSKVDEERIPAIDISLDPEEIITFGSTKCKVIDVGGHTKGHIAFYFPDEKRYSRLDIAFLPFQLEEVGLFSHRMKNILMV
jgi:glyoxylase-like metal-dependent hydrolase (beta-lactamase superfamily II)